MKSKTLSAFLTLFMLPLVTLAEDCDGFDPTCGDGTIDTPIDSWLLLLLVAGAVYGWAKHRKKPVGTLK